MKTQLIKLWYICLWLFITTHLSYSKTEVCGEIQYTTDWTPEGSPYIVTNDIYVRSTGRLRIHPGTTVLFMPPSPCKDTIQNLDWADSQYVSIKVEGIFEAVGKVDQPVIFQSYGHQKGHIGWDGIKSWDRRAEIFRIKHCFFRGAHRAIQLETSTIRVENSLFEWNNVGISLVERSNSELTNNHFLYNKSTSIFIKGSNPLILNNLVMHNRGYGIWSDSRRDVDIQYNVFWKNREGDCHLCPLNTLAMTEESPYKDLFHNQIAPPVFQNSRSHRDSLQADVHNPTLMSQALHKQIYYLELEYIQQQKEKASTPFAPIGTGPYVLSRYTTFRNQGHPDPFYKDADSTQNDPGMYGGHVLQ